MQIPPFSPFWACIFLGLGFIIAGGSSKIGVLLSHLWKVIFYMGIIGGSVVAVIYGIAIYRNPKCTVVKQHAQQVMRDLRDIAPVAPVAPATIKTAK